MQLEICGHIASFTWEGVDSVDSLGISITLAFLRVKNIDTKHMVRRQEIGNFSISLEIMCPRTPYLGDHLLCIFIMDSDCFCL